ncbi:MAG: DUF362 domain-containing protein [Candidatus Omnitrophica bacterium]|nr:DUF362 domain-containing protein [Candidatus Omnitrophota bacterium]
MNAQVSLVRCQNYAPSFVQGSVRKATDLLGGITGIIKPASRVLLKPNLLMGIEPERGVTTHPEVVRQVIRLLKEIDCKVLVGDSPSVWGDEIENIDRVYDLTGMKRLCAEEGVELVRFSRRRIRRKFPLTAWLDECDHLVSIPKFKTHNLTTLTGAIKNLFGLVCGTYKTEIHKNYFEAEDFARALVDIYEEAQPSLTIVDGIIAMEGEGPATGGKLRSLGLVLAGKDAVALDAVMARIMGIEPMDLLTVREAALRGLGEAGLKRITCLGERLEDLKIEPFLLPPPSLLRSRIPRPVVNLAKRLIRYYPCLEADNCVACATCIKACPQNAITLKGRRVSFNYSRCIACFCCQEVCPHAAIKIRRSALARWIGL